MFSAPNKINGGTMHFQLPSLYRSSFTLLFASYLFFLYTIAHAADTKITLAAPGPGNLLFMPIDLAKKSVPIQMNG